MASPSNYSSSPSTLPVKKCLSVHDYTVGWVCALSIEYVAATTMLDEEHEEPPSLQPRNPADTNMYTLGSILGHNVVIACLPAGLTGSTSATAAGVQMALKFPKIQFGLLVGVGGGVPTTTISRDIRLGDVVISEPQMQHGGVVRYDSGKHTPTGFARTGILNTPPIFLLSAVTKLKVNHMRGRGMLMKYLGTAVEALPLLSRKSAGEDLLFEPKYAHIEGEQGCQNCDKQRVIQRPTQRLNQDVVIYYGTIASGSSLIRDATVRDNLSSQLGGVACFEMEAAGLMNTFPCLVIRGISDYADSHKNKSWQPYAAATAAACAKEILSIVRPVEDAADNCGSTVGRFQSDSIFLQQRLIIREDVLSFLNRAFGGNSGAMVVLHGLPGVGKSTMARYFAYSNKDQLSILWVSATTKETISKGFEQYARQICGDARDVSEPVSIVRQVLSDRHSGRWLLILDGLDDTDINIEQYLFSDLPDTRVLVTTRHTKVASYVNATSVLRIDTLDRDVGESLLSKFMDGPSHTPPPDEELFARKKVVEELGGLPLAISIIGAALGHEGDGMLSGMDCRAYLKWPAEVQDEFLDEDLQFSGYSSSVWKAFAFAFQGIFSGIGANMNAASLAYFIASCDSSTNIAEYFQLFRQFESTTAAGNAKSAKRLKLDTIQFLNNGFFELAINKLAGLNMVIYNSSVNKNEPPYINMHSLIRRWIRRVGCDQVLSYTLLKMRLVAFGMYSNTTADLVRENQFVSLMDEIQDKIKQDPTKVQGVWTAMPDIAIPFLLQMQKDILRWINSLPAGPAEISRLRVFSELLHAEMAESYNLHFENIVWDTAVGLFSEDVAFIAEQFVEQHAFLEDRYRIKVLGVEFETFSKLALQTAFPDDELPALVGCTDLIQNIIDATTEEMGGFIDAHLSHQSILEAGSIKLEDSETAIHDWMLKWGDDIEEVIRRCLKNTITERCKLFSHDSGGNEYPGLPPQKTAKSLWDPRNAFFTILHQAAKAGVDKCIDTSDALKTLQSVWGDTCAAAVIQIKDMYITHRPLAGDPAVVDNLKYLADQMRLGQLGSYIAGLVTESVSERLKKAARAGVTKAFGRVCSSSVTERLMERVFSVRDIQNIFYGWDLSDQADIFNEKSDEEMTYIQLIGSARESVLRVMANIYNSENGNSYADDLIIASIDLIRACFDQLFKIFRMITNLLPRFFKSLSFSRLKLESLVVLLRETVIGLENTIDRLDIIILILAD